MEANIKMTGLIKKIALAGALGLASMLPAREAEAQGNVTGNVEYVRAKENSDSYARANAFYELPFGVKGFTFMELYNSGKGYFGKTALDKEVVEDGGFRLAPYHSSGKAFSQAGLGAYASVTDIPRTFAKIHVLPIWFSDDKELFGDKMTAGYFASINLPFGTTFEGFGEWDLVGPNASQWDYGEFSVLKKLSGKGLENVSIAYNPALLNDGDAIPKMQHRATVRVDFGGKN